MNINFLSYQSTLEDLKKERIKTAKLKEEIKKLKADVAEYRRRLEYCLEQRGGTLTTVEHIK